MNSLNQSPPGDIVFLWTLASTTSPHILLRPFLSLKRKNYMSCWSLISSLILGLCSLISNEHINFYLLWKETSLMKFEIYRNLCVYRCLFLYFDKEYSNLMYFFKEFTTCQSANEIKHFFIYIGATYVFIIYTKRDKFRVFKFFLKLEYSYIS